MKTTYPTRLKSSSMLACVALICVPAFAQFDSTDVSGFVDSRIDSYFGTPDKQTERIELFSAKADSDNRLMGLSFLPALAPDTPFWITHFIGAQYSFSSKHGKTDGSDTDQHNGTMSVFLDSQIGLSLKPSFKYSSADSTIPGGGDGTVRATAPSLGIGLEFLHMIRGEKYDPNARTSLLLGGNFGYADSDKDSRSALGVLTSSDTTTWTVGGLLSLSRYLQTNKTYKIGDKEIKSGAMILTLTPNYIYLDNRSKSFPAGTTTSTDSGTFALNSKLDWTLSASTKMSLFAIWYHDVTQKVAPGKTANYQDWAEFGGQYSVKLNSALKLSVSYSYEAFNSLYYNHKLAAGLDLFF